MPELDSLCSHKLHALEPLRYSEDFDYVRSGATPAAIVEAFAPCRPDGYTGRRAELNLREKLKRSAFREDIRAQVTAWPGGYDIAAAAELVITDVLARIE